MIFWKKNIFISHELSKLQLEQEWVLENLSKWNLKHKVLPTSILVRMLHHETVQCQISKMEKNVRRNLLWKLRFSKVLLVVLLEWWYDYILDYIVGSFQNRQCHLIFIHFHFMFCCCLFGFLFCYLCMF